MPLYFFVAGTDVVLDKPAGPWNWHVERNAAGVVTGRHPCYQFRALDERYWVRSRAIRDESSHKYVPLRDETGNVLQRADHFRVLRLHAPWSIPMFAGILPQTPDEDSSLLEKGKMGIIHDVFIQTLAETSPGSTCVDHCAAPHRGSRSLLPSHLG